MQASSEADYFNLKTAAAFSHRRTERGMHKSRRQYVAFLELQYCTYHVCMWECIIPKGNDTFIVRKKKV